MRKKYLSALLFGALLFASAGTFTSCKDYDDDIANLQTQVDKVVSDIKALQDAAGQYVTAVKYDAATGKLSVTGGNGETFQLAMPVDVPEYTLEVADGKVLLKKDGVTVSEGTLPETPEVSVPDAFDPELLAWGNDGYLYYGTTKIEGVQKPAVPDATLITTIYTTVKQSDGTEKKVVDGYIIEVGDQKAVFYVRTDLKSLVFQPDLYMDGVESMEYQWIAYKALKVDVSKSTTGTIKEGEKEISYSVKEKEDTYIPTATEPTFIYPTHTYAYHLNPTSAVVDNAELSLLSADKDFVITRSADAAPTVAFNKVEKGVMYVDIKMKGLDVKTQAWNSDQSNNENDEKEGYYPVESSDDQITTLALQAKLNTMAGADTTITSDYAGVYSSQIKIKAIAYQDDAKVSYDKNSDSHDLPNENGSHLYYKVKEAVENSATVNVAWNNETGINLNKLVATHWTSNSGSSFGKKGEEQAWASDEELAKYGLKYKFDTVDLLLGTNQTSESNNCYLESKEDGVYLIPSQVDFGTGKPNYEQSIATVGRTPLVRVQLVHTTDAGTEETVAVGYIKFLIVESEVAKETKLFKVDDVNYTCSFKTDRLAWHEIQNELLGEAAVTSKETFDALYELELKDGAAVQYVKNEKGEFVVASTVNQELGKITENVDPSAPTTTVIEWTIDQEDFVTYRAKATDFVYSGIRYVKYVGKVGGNTGVTKQPIYLQIGVDLNYPQGVLNNKIREYWYAENSKDNNGQYHEIHLNVEVPGSGNTIDGTADCSFLNDFDYVFAVNKTKEHNVTAIAGATATEANAPTFGVDSKFTEWQDEDLAYIYYFDAANNNKKVKGNSGKEYTLLVDYTAKAPYDIAYIDQDPYEYNNFKLYADVKDNDHLIAEIDRATGQVKYADTDEAKDILNYRGHSDLANTFTAIVGVAAFNECANLLPLTDNTFDALFLRPVDVLAGERDSFTDAVDADEEQAWAYVYDMVKLNDWRDRDFANYLDYFNYYGVTAIHIDTDKIRTNMNQASGLAEDKWPLLNTVTKEVGFNFENGTGTGAAPSASSTVAVLKDFYGKLYYWNNTTNVQAFDVLIPVTVSYKWGDITVDLKCTVNRTTQN